jgi:hypothetical protein
MNGVSNWISNPNLQTIDERIDEGIDGCTTHVMARYGLLYTQLRFHAAKWALNFHAKKIYRLD